MKFDKLTIYQPGLLLCDRQEKRLGESVAQCIAKPLFGAFGAGSGSIPCEMVAQGKLPKTLSFFLSVDQRFALSLDIL